MTCIKPAPRLPVRVRGAGCAAATPALATTDGVGLRRLYSSGEIAALGVERPIRRVLPCGKSIRQLTAKGRVCRCVLRHNHNGSCRQVALSSHNDIVLRNSNPVRMARKCCYTSRHRDTAGDCPTHTHTALYRAAVQGHGASREWRVQASPTGWHRLVPHHQSVIPLGLRSSLSSQSPAQNSHPNALIGRGK